MGFLRRLFGKPLQPIIEPTPTSSLSLPLVEVLAELAQSGVPINGSEDLERALAARPDLQAKLAAALSSAPTVPPQFQADLQQVQMGEQRYIQRGDLRGLDEAAAAWERILNHVTFAKTDNRFQLAALNNSGRLFLHRYMAQGQLIDLALALELWRTAVQHTPPDSSELPSRLNNLGAGLSARYAYTGQLVDLEEAIGFYEAAIQRTPPDSPELPGYLSNLGSGLRDRYTHTGQLADLEEAVCVHQTAVQRTPFDSPDLSARLNSLGTGLSARYAHTGQLADLEEAIRIAQTAVQRTPPDSPELPRNLNNLGNSLSSRYARTGQLIDLEEAIRIAQRVVQSAAPDSPELRGYLNNLGTSLRDRYVRTGQLADLEEAIRLTQRAIQNTPPDSPELRGYLSNLGNILRDRYTHTGQLADLEEAIRVSQTAVQRTPSDSPELPARLNNLGIGLRDRYARTSQLADLEEAIGFYEAAVKRTPSDSPELPARLNNLGIGLSDRYAHTGQLADLEEAIRVTQMAVQSAPPDSPELPGYLSNLGSGLLDRYARTGQLADLEEMIRVIQMAVHSAPPDSPKLSGYLNNLGSGLSARYARTGKLADLEEAINFYKTAVQRTLPGSPELSSYLNNLGTGLSARYARTGQLADLEEAIDFYETAVQSAPPGSPELPRNLNNLGTGLSARYARTAQLADLEEAVRVTRMAIHRVSPDSSELPGYLNNLGNNLRDHYAHTGQLADLAEAIRVYEQSCLLGQERQPETVIKAARSWGQWALARQAWDEAVRAYRYGLITLEQLYQTQLLQHELQSWQREGQGVYAQTAYALARVGDLSAVAVALEQGQARGLNDRLARDEANLLQVQQQAPALFQQYEAAATRLRQLEAAERYERLTSPGATTPPDWATHRQQAQEARTDLQAAIASIRQLDGYGQFLQPPEFSDVATAVRPGHPLAYLITTPVGSLALLLHSSDADTDVTIEPLWADAFTNDNLNAFLFKQENGEETGGYLPGQFSGGLALQAALAEGLPLLGEALLAPLAQRLQALELQRVTLIPSGRLNLLPLHAATIAVNGQPAIFSDLFAVSYAPSARVLSTSYNRRHVEATAPRLLAVGNPLPLPDGARPLPYARLEAEEIARRFGQTAHLVCAEAATHAAISTAMPGHTHLHFACHGQFDPEKPLESGLLLSGGVLTLRQILDDITLRGVRLVVLSACQTAVTDFSDLPDEVIGLPAAFLQAGAAGVLGSLWPVNDLSTMLLMDHFYHLHLDEGLDAAIALRRAQRWLRDVTAGELAERFGEERMKLRGNRLTLAEAGDYWRRFATMEPESQPFNHPYYWAAFTFMGA